MQGRSLRDSCASNTARSVPSRLGAPPGPVSKVCPKHVPALAIMQITPKHLRSRRRPTNFATTLPSSMPVPTLGTACFVDFSDTRFMHLSDSRNGAVPTIKSMMLRKVLRFKSLTVHSKIVPHFVLRFRDMAGRSVNKVILVGHLGKDAETRYTPAGIAVSQFTLATNRRSKDSQTGEWKDETDWHRIVLWRNDNLVQYLTKGKQVYLEGSLRTRSWGRQGWPETLRHGSGCRRHHPLERSRWRSTQRRRVSGRVPGEPSARPRFCSSPTGSASSRGPRPVGQRSRRRRLRSRDHGRRRTVLKKRLWAAPAS